MKDEEIILLSVGGLLILKYLRDAVSEITLPNFKPFLLVVAIISIIPLTIYFHNKWIQRVKEKEERRRKIEYEENSVRKLVKKDLSSLSSEEIKYFILKLKEFYYSERHSEEIKKKLSDAESQLRITLEEEKLHKIYSKEREVEERIEILKREEYERQKKVEKENKSILEHLDVDEKIIFLEEDLDKREIEALKNKGFEKTNEYDPILKKNKTFFVKKILTHSATHTFLVERIKQMLEQYISSKDIQISHTKEADIVFKIDNKKYAFEIEIGSLLEKKKRLKEKIEDLNNKFKDRWYFVVSHRDLIKKYNKYGKCTQRSGVRKIIEKLANSAHPILEGVDGDLSSEYY